MITNLELSTCNNCGQKKGLLKCTRCQQVYYCSQECQKEDWKIGNHKEICVQKILKKCLICKKKIYSQEKQLDCGHSYHESCYQLLQKYSREKGCLACKNISGEKIYVLIRSQITPNIKLAKISDNLNILFYLANGHDSNLSEDGLLESQSYLVKLFGNENCCRDRVLIYKFIENLSHKKGDPDYCYQYAYNLYHGVGHKKNRQQSLVWLKRASEQGHEPSMVRLAEIYSDGAPTIKKDCVESLRYYLLSAEKGNLESTYTLSWFFIHGKEQIPKDVPTGIKYLEECASKGHSEANFYLGLIKKNGFEQINYNYKEAVRFFLKAGEHAKAKEQLGDIYLWGLGVKSNPDISLKLYKSSERLGNKDIYKRFLLYNMTKSKDDMRNPQNYRDFHKALDEKKLLEKKLQGKSHDIFWTEK